MRTVSPVRRFDEEEEEDEKEQARRPDDALAERFLKTRTILLTGEINKELGERVIRQLLLLESLSSDPINVFIDSPGGDVDAGFAIFDMWMPKKIQVFLKALKKRADISGSVKSLL